MLKQLDWLVTLVKQYGKNTPFVCSCKCHEFHPNITKKRQECLLAIFHSLSLKEYKERLLAYFKGD